MRFVLMVLTALPLVSRAALPQSDSFAKNFKTFKQIASGIDFYAATREHVKPFEKGVQETRQRLATFLGPDLAPGAVVVCSTLAQKDSVNETRVLRMGYRWALIQLTPEASLEERLARMKAQLSAAGASSNSGTPTTTEIPAARLERLRNPSPEMKAAAEAALVNSTIQRVAYSILTTTLAPDKPFRASRLDDVARSPLGDWLDVGLALHAAGGAPPPMLRFLQEHMEEAFPLEDVLVMSRPFVFVAPGSDTGMMVIRVERPAGEGGGQGNAAPQASGGAAGARGGRGAPTLSKDVQDRMLFDGESASLFAFLVEKAGVEKVKALLQISKEGKDLRDVLRQPDYLGSDMSKAESDWQAWIKAQKVDQRTLRIGRP
jgi:hypothetical protein